MFVYFASRIFKTLIALGMLYSASAYAGSKQTKENFCLRAWETIEKNNPVASVKAQSLDLGRKTLEGFLVERGLSYEVNRADGSVKDVFHRSEQKAVSNGVHGRLAGLKHHLWSHSDTYVAALVLKGEGINDFFGRWSEMLEDERETLLTEQHTYHAFGLMMEAPVVALCGLSYGTCMLSTNLPNVLFAGAVAGMLARDLYVHFSSPLSVDDFRVSIDGGLGGHGFTHIGWTFRIRESAVFSQQRDGMLNENEHNDVAVLGTPSLFFKAIKSITTLTGLHTEAFVLLDVLAFRDADGEPVLAWYIRATRDKPTFPRRKRAPRPLFELPSLQGTWQQIFPHPVPVRVPER